MKVQQRHSFAGYTLPLQDRNVNWGIGESPIAPALSRRENPEDEVLRRWKGEMQIRTREIGSAEEAPLRTGSFRVPRLNGNYIFKPRGATHLPASNPTPGEAQPTFSRTPEGRFLRLFTGCATLTRLISRHSAIRHIWGFEDSSIPRIAIHTKMTSSFARSSQG
jgi:hypothetical protein